MRAPSSTPCSSARTAIVHVAGHGAPGPDGGVVLSGGTYLGATEVKAMRTVPELVFLNCCHLAARDASDRAAPSTTAPSSPPASPRR